MLFARCFGPIVVLAAFCSVATAQSPSAAKSRADQEAVPRDRLRAAFDLFHTSQIEAALNAFRQLCSSHYKQEDQALICYMTASCLRRLGRTAEAFALYREVRDSWPGSLISLCAGLRIELCRLREKLDALLAK